MTDRQKEFLKALKDNDHSEAPRRELERFVEMAYCAFAKQLALDKADDFEKRYMKLADGMKPYRVGQFAEMLGMVGVGLEESGGKDFLGLIAQHDDVRATNVGAGQFFTPWEVCVLMAKMTIHDAKSELDTKPYLTIGEPAVGAGAMVLAVVQELKEQGVDIHTQAWFEATDVSAFCQHMAFVQMSLVGCAGRVHRDDTLSPDREYAEVAMLPGSVPFIAKHGLPWREDKSAT